MQVPSDHGKEVLSFVHRDVRSKVFAVLDFSDQEIDLGSEQSLYHGSYADLYGGETIELGADSPLKLPPWSYRVLTSEG